MRWGWRPWTGRWKDRDDHSLPWGGSCIGVRVLGRW